MYPGAVHSTPLVRIRGLCFRYPGSRHDILRIPALEIAGTGLTALTGPAGAGKSTLVELLAGTRREPYEGSIEVLGVEWKALTRDADRHRQLQRIGLIPEDDALLPGGTVWELLDQDLTDAGVPPSEREARITRALRQVGLAGFFDRDSNQLSGGEQERVAIARMLTRKVDLVIAEEPTANLDPQLAWETISLLRKLAEHAPVIVVTHDTRVASMCDRTVRLPSAVDQVDCARPIHSSPVSPSPSRRPLVLISSICVMLALVGAGAGAALALHRSDTRTRVPGQATRSALPSPKPRVRQTTVPRSSVASHPATRPPAVAPLIRAAVRRSNATWTASMNCACDQGLESAETGAELRSDLQAVRALQGKGEHWSISLHGWHLDWTKPDSLTTAEAQVSKRERNLLYQGARIAQTCDSSYQVWYHLTKTYGIWKVDRSQVVGRGLTCRAPVERTSAPGTLLAQDTAVIRAHQYIPDQQPAATGDGFGQTLYAWRGTCAGSADGSCQKVFFFIGTTYLGTDTFADSTGILAVTSGGVGTINVTYANYQPRDALCCPSGSPVIITYHWDGTHLTPSGTPPGH